MCRFASFKHNPKLVEIVVADWFSHGNTEKLTGKTEAQGWFDGHYLPNGTIQCRIPNGEDRVMEGWIRQQWPTFIDFITWAVKNGANVHAKDEWGQTALHEAASLGWEAVARVLLTAGARVDARDNYSTTALYRAASAGRLAVVELLLDAKADPNSRTQHQETALHAALLNGRNTQVLRALIRAKADVTAVNADKNTALHVAAYYGAVDMVQVLVDAGCPLDARNDFGATALQRATYRGGSEGAQTIRVLIQAGANVNSQDNSGRTALIDAASRGDTQIVRLLLDAKADVNLCTTAMGHSARHMASVYQHHAVVKMLKDAGANV